MAIPRSAQIAAAFTVRGSSPSGRTTRLPSFARQLGQLVAEGWRRETAAALGGRGQRFDPVGVDVVGHVFLNFLDTLVIVNRYFEVKALQAQGGLPVLVLTINTGRPVAKARSHSLLMRASIS